MDILNICSQSIFCSLFSPSAAQVSSDKMQFYIYRLNGHTPKRADNSSISCQQHLQTFQALHMNLPNTRYNPHCSLKSLQPKRLLSPSLLLRDNRIPLPPSPYPHLLNTKSTLHTRSSDPLPIECSLRQRDRTRRPTRTLTPRPSFASDWHDSLTDRWRRRR